LVVGVGCQDDPIQPVERDPDTTFWHLSLNYHALVLSVQAPPNSVQLVATALNARGDTLSGVPAATFLKLENLDTTFTLSATGLVTAAHETARSGIVVRLTVDGITLADTAYLMIHDQPAVPLASFSILPEAPDSNWMWSVQGRESFDWPGEKQIQVYARDGAGNLVPQDEMMVAYWSERPDLARRQSIDLGVFQGSFVGDTGSVLIFADMYYYGTYWADTMRLYVIPPPVREIRIATIRPLSGPTRRELQPAQITIPAGTTIRWANLGPIVSTYKISDLSFLADEPSWPFYKDEIGKFALLKAGDSVDFSFDNAELIEAGNPLFSDSYSDDRGNLEAWASSSCEFENGVLPCDFYFDGGRYPQFKSDLGTRLRSFPIPGTYQYQSVRHPELRGTIVVTDSLRVPAPSRH
jgi:plastocyanin